MWIQATCRRGILRRLRHHRLVPAALVHNALSEPPGRIGSITMQAVAERMGMSRMGRYRHVDNKEQLLAFVVDELLRERSHLIVRAMLVDSCRNLRQRPVHGLSHQHNRRAEFGQIFPGLTAQPRSNLRQDRLRISGHQQQHHKIRPYAVTDGGELCPR